METPDGEVLRAGDLMKLGGGEGGHKNWKSRYFVLTDNLAYYASKDDFDRSRPPKGVISLTAYYAAESGNPEEFELTVHAYPKSMTMRASTLEERDAWLAAIQRPLASFS